MLNFTVRVGTLFLALFSLNTLANTSERSSVFIQASEGSFNHQAIQKLYREKQATLPKLQFSGTPLRTFEAAAESDLPAFVAIHNTLIPGHLVQASIKALQSYRVTKVHAGVILPIQMCVLRHHQAISTKVPLEKIASHPAALKQITQWKTANQVNEISVPKGTAEAARQVANQELPLHSAAIGSCLLAKIYPELVVVEKGIQDSQNNQTTFAMMSVMKRDNSLSQSDAAKELANIVSAAQHAQKQRDQAKAHTKGE
ncbi:prephenate dehydratase domain-containing protein [Algicola sagamiensis]|uniref:prephenate dehydratase domain-containing protein n=1 Tax=Algicola sagamiensis TaxID=163869 RepID=UPI0003614540|nr:prephenate dehydratase domain-containing protein [Algicola sagamiensis]